jgi:hypothetical protein
MTDYKTILQALQQKDQELVQVYTNTPDLQNEEGKLMIVLAKLEATTAALLLTLETLAKKDANGK